MTTAKEAMDVLRAIMKEDHEYAWGWHCNVAMAAVDAGAPHGKANEYAGQFMNNAFGINTADIFRDRWEPKKEPVKK
jgi:hypothetical protein